MMKVNGKWMAVTKRIMFVWMAVRFRPFPSFMMMFMVLIVGMQVFVEDSGMGMDQLDHVIGWPR